MGKECTARQLAPGAVMANPRTRCARCEDRFRAHGPWDILCGRCARQQHRETSAEIIRLGPPTSEEPIDPMVLSDEQTAV
jgi:hypothetical protein